MAEEHMDPDQTQQQVQALPWQTPKAPATPEKIDSYKVLNKLGQGGFGTVYQVQDTRRLGDFKEALKVLETAVKDERFDEEIEVLNNLNIPGVVKVHDYGSYQNCAYYVMESINNPQTILDYCLSKELSTESTIDLFIRTFDILRQVHQQDIIHRDLKPDNILEDASVRPHIIDFGIAKTLVFDDDIKRTGEKFIGTPLYASAQHFGDAADVSPLFDLYSLNIVFYMCLCRGMHPKPFVHKSHKYGFEVDTSAIKKEDRLHLFLNANAVPINQRNALISAELTEYFSNNLSISTDNRLASAAAIITALSAIRRDSQNNKVVLVDCDTELFLDMPDGYAAINRDKLQKSALNMEHIHAVITDKSEDYPEKKIIYCGAESSPFATYSFAAGDTQIAAKIQNLLIYLAIDKPSRPSNFQGQPYKSLLSYERTDGAVFFGRSSEIQQLKQLSQDNQLLCVLGESGIGKSSLIEAGLLLDHPCSETIKSNIDNQCNDIWLQLCIKQGWHSQWKPQDKKFHEQHISNIDKKLTIFFDQFEALLSRNSQRQELIRLFHFLKDNGIKTIIAVRSDCFALYKQFIHELQWEASEYTLYKPDRQALAEIITAPAIMAGKSFEFDQISGRALNEIILDEVIKEDISLPILSFTLDVIFTNSTSDMSSSVFSELGEFSGIVSQRAENILNSLELNDKEKEQALNFTLQKLIALDRDSEKPRRKVCALSEFPQNSPAAQLVNRLQQSHLLKLSTDGKQQQILFSHDSLINPQQACWTRIKQWIHQQKDALLAYEDFSQTFRKYQTSQKSFLNKAELARCSTMINSGWNLNKAELAFYKSSVNRRKLKNIVNGGIAALVLILLFFTLTFSETIEEQDLSLKKVSIEKEKIERDIVDLQKKEKTLYSNIQRSEQLLDLAKYDSQLAVARDLANRRGAYNSVIAELAKVPADKRDWLWSFILGKVMDFRHITLADHRGEVLSCDFSKDGKYFVSSSDDGQVILYQTKIWQKVRSYDLNTNESNYVVDEVYFTPDSRYILAGTSSSLQLLDLETNTALQTIDTEASVLRLKFSLDGTLMAASCNNGLIILYRYEKGVLTLLDKVFHKENSAVRALAFGKDNRLMSGGFDNSVSYWDCSGGKLKRTYNSANLNKPTHKGDILDCLYFEEEDMFFTVARDKNYCQWKTANPAKLSWKLVNSSHEEDITSAVTTSIDGKSIFISASSDRQIIFRKINPQDESILSSSDLSSISNINANGLTSLSRSADGKYLAIASADGTVSILNIQRALQREVDGSSYNLKMARRIVDLLPADNNAMYIITPEKILYWQPLQDKDPSVIMELPLIGGQYIKGAIDGKKLFLGSDDGQITVLDLNNKTHVVYKSAISNTRMTDMQYYQGKLFCIFADGQLCCGSVQDLQKIAPPEDDGFTSADFYIVCSVYLGTGRGWIYTCDIDSGKLKSLQTTHSQKVTILQASSSHLISCTDKSIARIQKDNISYSISNRSFGNFTNFRKINESYAISNSSLDDSAAIWRLRNGNRVDKATITAGEVLQTLSCSIAGTEYLVLRGRKNLIDDKGLIQQQAVIKLMPVISWVNKDKGQKPLPEVHDMVKEFVLDYGF
ncbi:MAG: protein kinase [Lentisphaeraceae bacterium]|nr:protein kinase [Lentisphaeraceae bacterium]